MKSPDIPWMGAEPGAAPDRGGHVGFLEFIAPEAPAGR